MRQEYNSYMVQWLKHSSTRQRIVTYSYPNGKKGAKRRASNFDNDEEETTTRHRAIVHANRMSKSNQYVGPSFNTKENDFTTRHRAVNFAYSKQKGNPNQYSGHSGSYFDNDDDDTTSIASRHRAAYPNGKTKPKQYPSSNFHNDRDEDVESDNDNDD